jgi:ATP-binding protein involved in chromosome partitioning
MSSTKLSKCTLFVGSGKGGVGKSTISLNLAVSLAKKGLNVALLDADIYGPSIPIMTGLRRLTPSTIITSENKTKVVPFTKFGISIISMGFFIEEAQAVTWRGPMLHGSLQKLITDVEWGYSDILIIDLPPGTGDVPITLSQLLDVDGALVVTTPQEVAMLDAIKAVNTFDILSIPLLGVIENMSGFTVPETQTTYHIFGQGKGKELAQRFNSHLLGSIPLIPDIRRGGDEGIPSAFHQGDNQSGKYFDEISDNLLGVVYDNIARK